jgi:triosephosphate isomerase
MNEGSPPQKTGTKAGIMRTKYIIGNWKMHTTAVVAAALAKAIVDGVGNEEHIGIILCPPFTYLALVCDVLKGSHVSLGAQNLYPEKEGAFTGEISPAMLLDLGCAYVILGHSERRHLLGENDRFINQKVLVALGASLAVILCIGESLEQRTTGQAEAVLARQLEQGLAGVSTDSLPRLIIAYEPIWAIGSTGHHATPQQVQDMHAFIRHRFGQLFGETAAQSLPIQYGGNVTPDIAAALLRLPDVDGALLGGASLIAEQFIAIVRSGMSESRIEAKSQ